MVVQNNRDGSGAFKASLATMGAAVINVPFFPAALLEVRLRRNIPLDDVLCNPEAGYERATALIAKKLVPLAQQEAVLSIVGEVVLAELCKLSAEAPHGVFYTLSKLQDASNWRLTANERLDNAWIAFKKCDQRHEGDFLAAASELRAALTSWRMLA